MILPNELLEIIFDFVHDKTAEPTQESQRTFAALALTSRQFLPLARSSLYYRPLPFWYPRDWTKAHAFISSLFSLGHLVRSLEGLWSLESHVDINQKSLSNLPQHLEDYRTTFSLHYSILKSCPFLVEIAFFSDLGNPLEKLLEALQPAALKTVTFGNFMDEYEIYGHVVESAEVVEALELDAFKGVEHLILDEIIFEELGSGEPSSNLLLKSFTLKSTINSPQSPKIRSSLPRNPSFLESVNVELYRFDQTEVDWFLEYLPSTLSHICLAVHFGGTGRYTLLNDYSHNYTPQILPSKFNRFNALKTLSFTNFDGPSLALLDTLADSSPLLASIDICGCKWIPSYNSIPIASPDGQSILNLVDLEDLKFRLLKFVGLRWIDLGLLPTTNEEIYAELEELRETKEIQIQWECAWARDLEDVIDFS